jgi:hypothetical protein
LEGHSGGYHVSYLPRHGVPIGFQLGRQIAGKKLSPSYQAVFNLSDALEVTFKVLACLNSEFPDEEWPLELPF